MQLLLILITAFVFSAVGFKKYVYFFSVGYGLSIAAIGTVMLIMFRASIQWSALIMCGLFIFYGLRLGLYLLYRELKSKSYNNLLKNELKETVPLFVKLCIWVACALLYVGQTAPVYFRLKHGGGADAFAITGLVLMAAGIILEITADMQKSKAKKADSKMFVSTGVYRLVRCPNYLGELLLWTGVFILGLNIYSNPFEWIVAVLGYIGIIYVMFSGARRLELRQEKNYGKIPEYREYVQSTPIMIPFVPIYSVMKYKWLVA